MSKRRALSEGVLSFGDADIDVVLSTLSYILGNILASPSSTEEKLNKVLAALGVASNRLVADSQKSKEEQHIPHAIDEALKAHVEAVIRSD